MNERYKHIIEPFHRLYYDNSDSTWMNTTWLGHHVEKCPLDLWQYQEIIHQIKPNIIIECGTMLGGSALFLAHMCDLVGKGRVLSIDIEKRPVAQHPVITYIIGNSTALSTIEKVNRYIGPNDVVLVILDSDHRKKHVLKELEMYAPLVTKGSYLIVEDTNINGHPVSDKFGEGPMEALDEWLPKHPEFEIDNNRERFYLTFNPRGYLRRK